MHCSVSLRGSVLTQTDVVHQAVVELPLQEIIDKSSSPGAREAWDTNLEELVLRIPDEAIEVSIAGDILPRNETATWGC